MSDGAQAPKTEPRPHERVVLVLLLVLIALMAWKNLPGSTRLSQAAAVGGPIGAAVAANTPDALGRKSTDPPPEAGAGGGALAWLLAISFTTSVILLVRRVLKRPPLLPARPAVPARWMLGDFIGFALFYLVLNISAVPLLRSVAPAIALLVQIAINLTLVALAIQIARSRGARAADLGFCVPADDGRGRPPVQRALLDAARGVIVYVAIAPVVLAVALLVLWIATSHFGIPPVRHPIERVLTGDGEGLGGALMVLAAVLFAAIVAPLSEETAIRGFLIPALERVVSPAKAIAISSALFAVLHPFHAMVPIFALACVLGVLFVRTRSLIAPVAAHVVYNSVIVALALLGQGT